jgi:hypothetical protein
MSQNGDFKYPPFKNPNAAVPDLPTPSAYRQTLPVFPSAEPAAQTRRFERKRLLRWFAAAIALHAAVILVLWLMPPLRLKWGPSSDQWVPITALPVIAPEPPPDEVEKVSKPPVTAKSHKAKPAVEPKDHPPTTD